MAEQTVTYIIGKDGKVHLEVDGVKGSSCRELVKATVDKLGIETNVELKPDYFETVEDKETLSTHF